MMVTPRPSRSKEEYANAGRAVTKLKRRLGRIVLESIDEASRLGMPTIRDGHGNCPDREQGSNYASSPWMTISRNSRARRARSSMPSGLSGRGSAGAKSDLDMLVEFERPVSLSEFLALEDALSALAARRVDLVTREALKPYIGRRVLDEAVSL